MRDVRAVEIDLGGSEMAVDEDAGEPAAAGFDMDQSGDAEFFVEFLNLRRSLQLRHDRPLSPLSRNAELHNFFPIHCRLIYLNSNSHANGFSKPIRGIEKFTPATRRRNKIGHA